jgi:c(7)-type cytochrome triheme protein
MASPEEYGNILINRVSEQERILPVAFSHWTHRLRYTCEVCHSELEFNMKLNNTEINHLELENGRYCGACHDGKTAFDHKESCFNCHNGDSSRVKREFVYFGKKPFPTTEYGNGIDWTESLRRGLISPRRYLKDEPSFMNFDRTVELTAEMGRIPPAYFSHKSHLDWMNCDMCHPELFNIKRKATEGFSMNEILKGNFCGVCHLNVAFPIDDCSRCHPEVRSY